MEVLILNRSYNGRLGEGIVLLKGYILTCGISNGD